jgi:alcohol dehydrogenase (NADP+)
MQASSAPYVTLNNGTKFPQIGLGTFLSTEGDCFTVVKESILNHGYRAIDTATIYQNEEVIGNALQEVFAAGIKREDLFITTKLWQSDKDDVEGTLRTSLKKLKLEYIDLYLVHWMAPKMVWEDAEPIKNTPTHKIWAELERLVDAGLIKNIGVSNCSVSMLVDLWSYARHKPVIN